MTNGKTLKLKADAQASLGPLAKEAETYFNELPRMLNEGNEGRYVLIKGSKIIGLWDTDDEAYQAGLDRFGLGVPFLAQPIDRRDIANFAPFFQSKAKRGSK